MKSSTLTILTISVVISSAFVHVPLSNSYQSISFSEKSRRFEKFPVVKKMSLQTVRKSFPSPADFNILTVLDYRICCLVGIRNEHLNFESWVWSHAARYNMSILLRLTADIEEAGGPTAANPTLLGCRRSLLTMLLRHDYPSYVRACTALGGLVPRHELPNVQDVPYPGNIPLERKAPQPVNPAMLCASDEPDEIPDCTLPKVAFAENPLDRLLLWLFRRLVQGETNFASPKEGILGLLDEGREFMLRPNQTAEAQHRMVRNALGGLMTPVMPPFYRIFMSGIFGGGGGGGGGDEPLRLGPWPWAPGLTALVTPPFFGFLVGPSRPNRRRDGEPGGLLVEKCKFLQESGCKALCVNQCKLPAQAFFGETLGLPLTVTPNFATQECQWSFGELPPPPDRDPAIPRGCVAGCPTRTALRQAGQPRPCA